MWESDCTNDDHAFIVTDRDGVPVEVCPICDDVDVITLD